MKAAGVSTSSIDSGSLPSNSSKMVRISCAFLINWLMSWFRNWRDSWSLALISSDSMTGSADVASSPSWKVAPIWKEKRLLSGESCAWKEDEVRWPIETKEWWNRPEGRYLLVLGIFPLNWSQQGRRAVMKNSGLQCLAGQIIQTMYGRQAEECLSEYTECIHKRALRSYLYQRRVCPRFSGGRRQVLYLMKSKGNDAKSRIMGGFEYLLYK